jgi:hypothetical protein
MNISNILLLLFKISGEQVLYVKYLQKESAPSERANLTMVFSFYGGEKIKNITYVSFDMRSVSLTLYYIVFKSKLQIPTTLLRT